MSNDTLEVGLFGTGRIGRLHAQHLAYSIPGAHLRSIADIDTNSASACAANCRVDRVESDYRRILDDDGVQAVVICTPTDSHARLIEEAAQAGKHIFCEKPIAHSLIDIDRALDAAEKARVKLQIGFNRRFDANFSRVRKALRSGEIGAPLLLHIISRDPAPPPVEYVKKSGGIFLDMTIHDFDMARFLMGCEVEEVFTSAAVKVDPAIGAAGDYDTAVIMLRYTNGVIGTIDNCRKAVYGYDQRVEVLGSDGGIHVDNNYPNTAIVSDSASVRRDLPLNFFMERYTESFLTEMRSFVRAVLLDEPVEVTGADGRAAVVMGLAARKSKEENRPVKLSEIT
ncbi:MAG: inositol 2-dehydrogenase [Candidatus Hydrogenedentes bacterium]|nr:inositol 2-dehydrogenase [Candidatus Hydrogenedentota bacterium]